jgi:tRNA-modifying protein YgfZ
MDKFHRNASPDYWNTLEGAGFFMHPETGCLRFSDQGGLEFLQRQTTNDLNGLRKGKTVTTLLVSPTGQILDVLRLIEQGEHILALTLPGHSRDTLRYLAHRIFFMDKVQINDVSSEFSQVELDGLITDGVLRKIGLDSLPALDEIIEMEFRGNPLWVIGKSGYSGHGVLLVAPARSQIELKEALLASAAVVLSPQSYHILRVESGSPTAYAELTEEYTPLEVGMEQAVSESKGCYPGQEVIARQITYDKVTQRLVGLKPDSPVLSGDRLFVDGKPVGRITSSANSPRFGPIALGVVKRPYHEAGAVLEAQISDRFDPVRVVVVELPFREK